MVEFSLLSLEFKSVKFMGSDLLLPPPPSSIYLLSSHIKHLLLARWVALQLVAIRRSTKTDQFIFILSHSGLKTTKFAQSSANWPKMGPDSSQVAPSGPSNPN